MAGELLLPGNQRTGLVWICMCLGRVAEQLQQVLPVGRCSQQMIRKGWVAIVRILLVLLQFEPPVTEDRTEG